jgi:hypothetical protein
MVPLRMVVNPFIEGVHWLFPIVSLAAALVCFMFRGISGRLLFVMLAFVLEALVLLGLRVAFVLQGQGALKVEDYLAASTMVSVLHLIVAGLLVVGLAATFADIRRRLGMARPRKDYPGDLAVPRYPDDHTEEWDVGRKGQDIQH